MADEKLELVTEDADPQKVAEDMACTIWKMYEDLDKKSINAKESLVESLKVTSEKYLTANGVMNALGYVRDVFGTNGKELTLAEEFDMASEAAVFMSRFAETLSFTVDDMDPDDLGDVCEGMYKDQFATGDFNPMDMIKELMKLTLFSNVGPDARDIANFCKHANEEIKKARQDLREFCTNNDIDFFKLCKEE